MAQQQRRPGAEGQGPSDSDAARMDPQALANAPFAWWSSMANTQREFFSAVMRNASDRIEQGESGANLRPEGGTSSHLSGQNLLATTAEYQREVASFITDRVSKDRAFMSEALKVTNLQQLMQLQAGWMTQAMHDYSAEFGKLADLLKQNNRNSP